MLLVSNQAGTKALNQLQEFNFQGLVHELLRNSDSATQVAILQQNVMLLLLHDAVLDKFGQGALDSSQDHLIGSVLLSEFHLLLSFFHDIFQQGIIQLLPSH